MQAFEIEDEADGFVDAAPRPALRDDPQSVRCTRHTGLG